MRSSSIFVTVAISSCLILSGCAAPASENLYSHNQLGSNQAVQYGTITNIRVVTVEGSDSYVGKIGGAVIGGIIGSQLNHGKGAWALLGGTAGALGGAVAGTKTEERVTRKDALEITVQMGNGVTRAVVQQAGNERFQVGDTVRFMTDSKGQARVTH